MMPGGKRKQEKRRGVKGVGLIWHETGENERASNGAAGVAIVERLRVTAGRGQEMESWRRGTSRGPQE